MNVDEWLRGLGLGQYAPLFRRNHIDGEVLRLLTAEDLRDLGVGSIGHRRLLLDAIATLAEAPTPDRRPVPGLVPEVRHAARDAERRQVTVMFCDLVGSTSLSSQLDPEDLREVIASYHHAVEDVVGRFDGFISRYMGDGVLVYFGYPQAHEDDAERAVRAGLDIVAAVGRLDVKSTRLQTRVGIATGLVVVGDVIGEGPAQEQLAVGETPNLAARLQAVAEPDAVVIAGGTHRLVGKLFDYRDLGPIDAKGFPRPVAAWQVLRASILASRFEALRGTSLSRLVGRDEEIDLLLRRWVRAKAGHGQIVVVSGEPGVGKSRIVAALAEHLRTEPHTRLRYFCSPYHQDSPLYPIIEQLGRASVFANDDPPAAKLEKLELLLARTAPPDEDVAVLADLLSLPNLERHRLPNLVPQRKKARTFEALIRQLESLARQQPVMVVFEDAHWIDPTSQALLDLTVARVRSLPVLLIVTLRPELQLPWMGQPQVTMLALNRLDQYDRKALIAQVAGGTPLPDDIIDQIAERTDGIPLFVEELTKSVLESGLVRDGESRYGRDRALASFAIPTSLHASLMARLDRMTPVRHVAQIGAAIGREFSYALLRTVSGLADTELRTALDRLVGAELVFQRGAPPDSIYSFKHALVQDAAHSSLLRGFRQQLHARIGDALETQFPDLTDNQPELLAQHYAEAGLVEKSISYWAKAGRRSAARSAMAEAAAQFQKGLDQLAVLPDNGQRQQQELELVLTRTMALRSVRGYSAPEVEEGLTRARALSAVCGDFANRFSVEWGLFQCVLVKGDLERARALAAALIELAKHETGPALVDAHLANGMAAFNAGEFDAAVKVLETAVALSRPKTDQPRFLTHGQNAGLFSLSYLARAQCHLGLLDRGRATIERARALATTRSQDPGHIHSLLNVAIHAARVYHLCGDLVVERQLANEVLEAAHRNHYAYYEALAKCHLGWVTGMEGHLDGGIAILTDGIAALKETGTSISLGGYYLLLAQLYVLDGQREDAERALTTAATSRGQAVWTAEIERVRGDIMAADWAAAEVVYRSSLAIARRQGAALFACKAAVGLARLLLTRGRRQESRLVLQECLAQLPEGDNVLTVRHARALLADLIEA